MDELIGGGIAGMAQTIVGYPLDTLKVNYVNSNSSNLWKCMKSIGGFKGYYRGVLSPTYGAIMTNTQTFYTYSTLLPHTGVIISGGLTGALLCIIETPTELIKCRMQINTIKLTTNNYKTCIRDIYYRKGIKGFYHGFCITMARNTIGVAGLFWGYNSFKNKFENKYLSTFLAGVVGGFACWAPMYPIDCLKTHVQTHNDFNARYYFKKYGFKRLWIGFTPCIIRAMVVNPFIFLAYEVSLSYLKN